MHPTLALTPHGRLILGAGAETESTDSQAKVWHKIEEAFAQSSAHGLIALARYREVRLPGVSEFAYWREFSDTCLAALAHATGTTDSVFPESVPMPPEAGFEWTLRIPAMRGAEYADPEIFVKLWNDLVEVARQEAPAHDGPRPWLTAINAALHLLGKVTFHLAENKRSPETPFAFMATFTHRLASGDKPVHLPLARALQEFAGTQNRTALKSLLDPVQKAAETSAWVRELLESRRVFQPQAWTAGQAHSFLREVPALESSGIITRIPNWWKNGRGPRPKVRVRVGGDEGGIVGIGSMLDFSIETTLNGHPLTRKEWKEMMASGDGLISLRGQWIEVDREKLQEVLAHWEKAGRGASENGVSFLEAMRLLAGFRTSTQADTAGADTPDWSEVMAGGMLRETLEALVDPSRAADFDPNEHLTARLRPYQEFGVKWLWLLQKLGLGACLADDMGLGKTIQVLALLNRLKHESPPPHSKKNPPTSLLIAPASLLANWMAELSRFAPHLRAICLHSSTTAPEQWRDAKAARTLLDGCDLAITTYGQAGRLDWIAAYPWRILILDEAQAIKNPGSKQTRSIKQISAQARIALSGTPVENRLGDLWSLYDFLNPGLLGNAVEFTRAIKTIQAGEPPDFSPLRKLVHPYLLRRLKTDRDLIPDLPDKSEVTAWCPLAKKQAALYQRTVEDLAEKLDTLTDGIQRRGLVLAYLMRFKQICNHPAHWLGNGAFAPEESGKFERLAALIEEIASRQEKVLVFTQFREMTEPLADWMKTLFGQPGLILHGGTPVKQRSRLVSDFEKENGPPFFVLSLKAGGTGLNLTSANHVVHFDRWWNPAVENQATDRAFRIGQKRNVLVHKFVCRGTIEERIDELISRKKALADSVLGADGGAEKLLTEMNNKELLDFVALDIRSATGE